MDNVQCLLNESKNITETLKAGVEIVIYIYAALQKFLRKKKNVTKCLIYPGGETVFTIITILLTVLLYIVLLIAVIYYTIYRFVLHLQLKRKYGSEYAGLLEGADAVWAIEDRSRAIINCLMVVECDKDGKDFYEAAKARLKNTLRKCPKFTYLRQNHKNYLFYLKNKTCDDDVFKSMDLVEGVDELDRSALMDLLSKYSNAPMPRDDTATYEVRIGTQRVLWRRDKAGQYRRQYPVMYRVHHCAGDGLSIQNMILRHIVDDNSESVSEKFFSNNRRVEFLSQPTSIEKLFVYLKLVLQNFYRQICYVSNLRVNKLSHFYRRDRNIIHGPELCGEKHLVWLVEDKPKYVSMVKSIKKKLPGVGFSDLVLTAVARSLREYFKEKTSDSPESISMTLTVLPTHSDVRAMMSRDIDMANRFSLPVVRLPTSASDTFLTALKKVRVNLQEMRNSIGINLTYWQMKILTGLLPVPAVVSLSKSTDSTMALSNVPGTAALHILGGYKILDFIFWIPNKLRVGLGMSIYTYDNRFQLGYLVDKSVIEKREDVVSLLENVFKNIEVLYNETKDTTNIVM